MPTNYSRYLCKTNLHDNSKKVHTEIFVKLLVVVDLGLGGLKARLKIGGL